MEIRRRDFLAGSAAAAAGFAFGGCATCAGCAKERVPYGDTIGDRLWMWGHHAMSFASMKGSKEGYNLPYDRRIDMADACRSMNIPGCFVVRWRNLPTKDELPGYMTQFAETKRVGFSITDSAKETFDEKVRLGLAYADKMPNLTTLIMDDYWSSGTYAQSYEHLVETKKELTARKLKLGVVLYSDANGVKAKFKDVLDLCDEVTFWFWNGKNVVGIDWRDPVVCASSFLTIFMMGFTGSITNGIAIGVFVYTAGALLTGRKGEVSGVMYILTAVFLLYFVIIYGAIPNGWV